LSHLKNVIKNNLKAIGIVLIAIAALIYLCNIFMNYQEQEYIETIITESFSEESKGEVNNIRYLGYIYIPEIGSKRLIRYGTSARILDANFVGKHDLSAGLDEEYGNIILAGHNTRSVFANLRRLSTGDIIIIGTHHHKYTFEVSNKKIIEVDDFGIFEAIDDRKVLTIITCTKGGKQRLVVTAELVEE